MQWKKPEDTDINPYTYVHLKFDKDVKNTYWKKGIFNKWC